jgi:ferredoxin
VTLAWDEERFASLLELAESAQVPAASGCRVGACHGCKTRVARGRVAHAPDPPAPPGEGDALLCCARPEGDVVLDL